MYCAALRCATPRCATLASPGAYPHADQVGDVAYMLLVPSHSGTTATLGSRREAIEKGGLRLRALLFVLSPGCMC